MARSKFEIKCHKELEEQGWQVDYKIRPSGYKNPSNYNADYLGLFDILALKDGVLRWISIKGTAGVPKKHRRAIEQLRIPGKKEVWYYRKLKGKGNKFIPKKERWDGKWYQLNK